MRNRPIRLGEVGRDGSWLALVAETTPGMGTVVCQRVEVRCLASAEAHAHRLIVQAYALQDVGPESFPQPAARPLGSCQRTVDADELRAGVEVSLVHASRDRDVVVLAWAERGAADLDFDALGSRPRPQDPQACAVATGSSRVVMVLRTGVGVIRAA